MTTRNENEQRQGSDKPSPKSPAVQRREEGRTPHDCDEAHEDEILDEELEDTFPASDPPPAQPGTTRRRG